jgi:hypothetical protein
VAPTAVAGSTSHFCLDGLPERGRGPSARLEDLLPVPSALRLLRGDQIAGERSHRASDDE